MRKKRTKFGAFLMASMLCMTGLVGCTSTSDDSATTTATQDTQQEQDTSNQDVSNNNEEESITTTLTVWGPSEDQSSDYGNWLQTQCENFSKEHPNWDIEFKYGVCSEADAAGMIAQDPDNSADVFLFANDKFADLIAANGVSKIGGETAEYVKNTNSETLVNSVTVDGSLYGIPFTTNTWFMYYDKSVFTEDDIKNLDTMLEKGRVAFPLSNSWYIASFYLANGGTMYGDGTDGSAGINFGGEAGQAVTDYLIDLAANKNFVDDANGVGIAGLRDGSISAIFSGSWDCEAVKKALGDNWGVASLPTITINGEEKQLMSFAGSKAVGVNPNTEYPQVAVALAKYLAGPEAQEAHYKLRNVVPCNLELLQSGEIQSDQLVLAQNNTFENTSIIQPFVAEISNFWTPAENFGKSIINGEVTHENSAEKTEEFNKSINSSIVD